jgi:hypothetical protein
MNALLVSALLASASAPATLAVRVVTDGLPPAQAEQVAQATEAALREQVSWSLQRDEGGACADDACLLKLAAGSFAVEVQAAVVDRVLQVRAAFADAGTGRVVRKEVRGGSPAAPAKAVRLALEAALPAWSGRGQASVVVSAPAASVVKVNGRRVAMAPVEEPLGLEAGVHEVDVLLPSGDAVMWRRRLVPGARHTAEVGPLQRMATAERPDTGWRKPAAYALWSAGALAVAGAFVAGGLARQDVGTLRACTPADRTRNCTRMEDARIAHARGESYARTGNLLLVGGLVLGGAGAGLYTFDLMEDR